MIMDKLSLLIVVVLASVVFSSPIELSENDVTTVDVTVESQPHRIEKRFINPLFSSGALGSDDLVKIRAKRSEEDCEKLQLCKLHSRANRNFFSAFELYFVNKENARLWDHQVHSAADCERRYSGCYYN